MSLTTQFCTMLAMIAMGSFFGAALDTYSRFLKRGTRKRWLVFINDVLFWLFFGLATFYVLYLVNFGEIRFYIFLALICGYAAYQAMFKTIYLRILETFIKVVVRIYRFFVKSLQLLLVRPIRWMLFVLISIIMALLKGLWSLVKIILLVLLWLLRVIWKPVFWILKIFWGLMPKKIKKSVEKLYNYFAGKSKQIKNKLSNMINSWKKDKNEPK
ncbi:spore cortex biosynthesis protein YabQ [Falsibacillus albus]|uniref:Spore cortex biosynthesis protein YabQ n=2 Tax=Falsibacillus albus TaxID=2478915 RepID=A0A3L7JLL2_9BACI|nr:spore cortex biosynthesis protein YabQ [Falsibacillus albus]